jgi:hypothetical protein
MTTQDAPQKDDRLDHKDHSVDGDWIDFSNKDKEIKKQFSVVPIPFHTHNGTDSPPVQSGVSTVSVVSANGFAGTVATATTKPAITISTSVNGILKGNGTAISAATSGTDYAPATSGTSVLKGNGSGGFSNAVNTDLPVGDATHSGAVPTPPNNTTTFLRGDMTFATPTSTSITYKTGSGSHTAGAGNITIAHGLGKTPVFFIVETFYASSLTLGNTSIGAYDGTNYSCIARATYTNANFSATNSSNTIIKLAGVFGNDSDFFPTWDATNVTLVNADNDQYTFVYQWKAWG